MAANDWISGLQRSIDYIEDHLQENIDYEAAAAQSFSSSFHFQRIFSILCGYTLGEYIRNRRLSLAGTELASGDIKVIDAALKYGYESPDSFARAFQRFHGVLPSQVKSGGCRLRSFSRLVLKFSMEGGTNMNYRIEEKPELILTGYRAHFTGTPYGEERERQEGQLFVTTRGKQWFLKGAAESVRGGFTDEYCVVTNITDEGYDFCYCHDLDEWTRAHLCDHSVTGVDFVESLGLETITIPGNTYVIFETEDVKHPIADYLGLLNQRIRILTEWMPDMGFELAEGPELAVYQWMPRETRKIQIWMPIRKIGR